MSLEETNSGRHHAVCESRQERVSVLQPPATLSFFFSSRRRHTRSLRDWSSDVCSSDLLRRCAAAVTAGILAAGVVISVGGPAGAAPQPTVSQVQARLRQLTSKAEKLDQHYNQVQQELTSASQR